MKILTSLVLDGKTVNLLVSGESAQVLVSDVACTSDRQDSESCGDSDNTPLDELISAHAVRELTGKKTLVPVSVREKNDCVIQFTPDLEKDVNETFTLAVLCRGEHIQGSPFLLQFVGLQSLSSIQTESVEALVDVEQRVNVVLPPETGGEVEVKVKGPFGPCDANIHHWPDHSVSVNFMPDGAGQHAIHVTMNKEEVKNSPYLICADFSFQEALLCYVMEDNQHLFEQTIKFGSENPTFHISTESALLDSNDGSEKLSVLCSGPGKADVLIRKDPEILGLESCTVVPSVPGDYRLSILWKGRHIRNSPLTMKFRHPRSVITCQGLDIHSRSFKVGLPHRFKLNSSDMVGGRGPEVQCVPHTGASVSLTAINESKTLYRCEVFPLEAGRHEIIVKCLEKHIEGSPFVVEFEDVGDASACAVVETSRDLNSRGNVRVKISTDGAGPGILEAVVERMSPDGVITDSNVSVTKTRLSDTMHLFQFSLNRSVACSLQVTYNGLPICGSPFKLVFGEMGRVRLRGEGLLAGRVGEWNCFIVQAVDLATPLQGEPHISVTDQEGRKTKITVTPTACKATTSPPILVITPTSDLTDAPTSEITPSTASCDEHEVKYFPEMTGKYKVDVRWGLMPVPGSPFFIYCSSAIFQVQNPPQKVELGSIVEFSIQHLHGDVPVAYTDLTVVARSNKGDKIKGIITGPPPGSNQGDTLYRCTLALQVSGKHVVNIKWNKLHIKGSPFCVKVTTPPKPECVHVYGPGVQNGVIGMRQFTVETAEAGAGMLAIQVSIPSGDDKREKLALLITPCEENRRTLCASYHPTVPREHTIDVKWAEMHVPGSPFKVELFPDESVVKMVVVADVYTSGDVAVDIEGEWREDKNKELNSINDSEEGRGDNHTEGNGEEGENTYPVTANMENSIRETYHVALHLHDEDNTSATNTEQTPILVNGNSSGSMAIVERESSGSSMAIVEGDSSGSIPVMEGFNCRGGVRDSEICQSTATCH